MLLSRIKYDFDSTWICSLIQNVPWKDAQPRGPAQSFHLCCLTAALGWLGLGKRFLGQCGERFLCMDSVQGSAARPDSAGAVPALPRSSKPCFLGFPETQFPEHCRECLDTMPCMLGWTRLRQVVQPPDLQLPPQQEGDPRTPVLLLAAPAERPIPALLQPRHCGSRAAEPRRSVLGDTVTATR